LLLEEVAFLVNSNQSQKLEPYYRSVIPVTIESQNAYYSTLSACRIFVKCGSPDLNTLNLAGTESFIGAFVKEFTSFLYIKTKMPSREVLFLVQSYRHLPEDELSDLSCEEVKLSFEAVKKPLCWIDFEEDSLVVSTEESQDWTFFLIGSNSYNAMVESCVSSKNNTSKNFSVTQSLQCKFTEERDLDENYICEEITPAYSPKVMEVKTSTKSMARTADSSKRPSLELENQKTQCNCDSCNIL